MRVPYYAAAAVLLTACGGTKDNPNNNTPDEVDYRALKSAPVTDASLSLADSETLTTAIKNGIRLQLDGRYSYTPEFGGVPATPDVSASSSSSGSAGDSSSGTAVPDNDGGRGNFTETNVHVQGVDEADWVKYDGKHWFIAVQPGSPFNNVQSSGVEIVATDPASATANVVSYYAFDDSSWGQINDFYLVQKNSETTHLTSIRNQHGLIPDVMPGWGIAVDLPEPFMGGGPGIGGVSTDAAEWWWPYPVNGKIRVQMLDVTDTTRPTEDFDLTIDGTAIESRKIGNTLYLITRYDPWLADVDIENGDDSIRAANEAVLQSADASKLLPSMTLNGISQPLSTDCLMQTDIKPEHGLSSLVHITAIDLAEQTVLSSQCVNSALEVISMTPNNLYLTGTVYNSGVGHATVIHKFALGQNGPEYAASGSVEGILGWRADPVFRMHEHEDDFRIVTTQWNAGPEHRLFVLEQDGNKLKTVASLPNENRPAAIGKPDEDIRAVRFEGNTGYIVTFRQTDPLYKIDLSDRLDPKIAGELEITGFATYMHPIGENYLFTIGNEADENGRVTALKAELVDVSGDDPVVAEKLILGERGSHSEALQNLHALNVLEVSEDQFRVAFPLAIHETFADDGYPSWSQSGLQMLEINGASGNEATLSDAGMIVAADRLDSPTLRRGLSRGILHDDAVFFTHGSAIWSSFWVDPENAMGPILIDPIACTAVVLDGLRMHVVAGRDSAVDACEATVTATDGDYTEQLTPMPGAGSTGSCVFGGAAERPGVYDVTATLEGHSPNTVTEIVVSKGLCHVDTAERKLYMEPL